MFEQPSHPAKTEREGFEPSSEVNPRYAISSRARSTAPAPLQCSCCRLPPMLLAASQAVSKDVGLLATFLGIGVIVNVIVVFIAVQIRGERHENQRRRS